MQSQLDHIRALRRGEQRSYSFMEDATEPLTPSRPYDSQKNDGYMHDFVGPAKNLTRLDKSPEQTPKQRRMQMQLLGRSMADDRRHGQGADSLFFEESVAERQSVRSSRTGAGHQREPLSSGVVKLTFAVILFLNLIINIDHGVMPAGAITIKDYLGVSNTEYGLLGSIVFFGLVLGSLAATVIFNNYSTKLVLGTVMALNALSQVGFTLTKDYHYLITSRFLTGFFQVFISIYWPVWTDGFAPDERTKATWMSCLLAASPVGVLLGYVMTTMLMINLTWKYAFYVQAVAVVPVILVIVAIPKRYFSLKKLGSGFGTAGADNIDDSRSI